MLHELVIASHNAGKVREIGALLAPLGVRVSSAADHQVSEPEETGATFTENAELKSRHTMLATKLPSLSDDSGLVIPALDGDPGIYSARWAGPGKDFSVAFERIRQGLAKNDAPLDSPCYFVCVLCLALPDGTVHNFEGRAHGALSFPPRGEKGFGYDPIFTPEGFDATFAEIDPEVKNSISHRAKAFAQFVSFIREAAA